MEAGQATAQACAARFADTLRWLQMWPESGPPRPALGANARIAIVRPFLIIYDHEQDADAVTLLRVVQASASQRRCCVDSVILECPVGSGKIGPSVDRDEKRKKNVRRLLGGNGDADHVQRLFRDPDPRRGHAADLKEAIDGVPL